MCGTADKHAIQPGTQLIIQQFSSSFGEQLHLAESGTRLQVEGAPTTLALDC